MEIWKIGILKTSFWHDNTNGVAHTCMMQERHCVEGERKGQIQIETKTKAKIK